MSATYSNLRTVCSSASSTLGRATVALLAFGLLGANCGDDSRVASGTPCDSNQDCEDGLFCNGQEYCAGPSAGCRYYPPPCGDGFSCDESSIAGDDCDDRLAGTHPGQNEACNDVDDDCDGATDEGVLVIAYADTDRDGYGTGSAVSVCPATAGVAIYDGDCNDASAQVHPSQDESCNGADDDCDTQVDEGVLTTLYTDADHDGFGTGSGSSGCASNGGASIHAGDCDDANPELSPGTLRCVTAQGTAYQLCSATGVWSAGNCPQGLLCISQPGGFGVCAP